MTRQELEKPDISELASICKAFFIHYHTSAPSSSRERAKRQWGRFSKLGSDLKSLARSNGCGVIRDLVATQLSVLRINLEFALHHAKVPGWSDISSSPQEPERLELIQQVKGTLLEPLDGIEATIDRLEEARDIIRQHPALDHESESTVGPDLCVGIDFGTTPTAVSWSTPMEENLASGGKTRWGFLYEELVEGTKWRFDKLLLTSTLHKSQQRNAKRPHWVPGTTDQSHEHVTLYLREMYTLISNEIPKIIKTDPTFSQQLKLKAWDSLAIDFIFSTPTAWDAPVSQCFREIVSRAGFGEQKLHKVMLGLTEAEAAVVFACQPDTAGKVQKGDVALSIHAGGGITNLAFVNATADTADSLTLEDTYPVVGVGVGSIKIDREFARLIEDRIERHPEARSELPESFAWEASQSDDFQTLKNAFRLKKIWDEFDIKVPGLEESYSNQDIGILRGRLYFTRSQLEGCFDIALQGIKDLIEEALARFEDKNRFNGIFRHVNWVVLSGSLGHSDYVLKELTTHFNDVGKKANSCVARSKVIRAEGDARMAVAHGLLYGRGAKAYEYSARANYGIIVEEPRSRGSARYPAGPTIRWLVQYGDTIQSDKPITVDITKRLEQSDQGKWTEKIVCMEGDRVCLPKRVKDGLGRSMKELHSVDLEVPQGTKLSSSRTWWGRTVYPDYDFKLMLSVGPSGDCSVEVSENVIKLSG